MSVVEEDMQYYRVTKVSEQRELWMLMGGKNWNKNMATLVLEIFCKKRFLRNIVN